MGLFDSLRAKLKGVSKKLETEVEKSLGDQLEAELAAAVQKEQAKTQAVPAAPAPAAPPTPAPVPAPTPAPAAAPAPAPPTPPARTDEPVEREDGPASAVSASSAVPAPAAVHVQPVLPARPVVPAPAPQSGPTLAPARTAESAERAEPVSTVAQVAVPAAVPAAVQPPAPRPAPTPAPVAASPKPKPAPQPQPVGKKLLSDDEISARLERELFEAVAVQKTVEETVQAQGPSATRFTINDEILEEILWDLEVGLLESDVALPVIEAIKANVKEQLLSMSVGGSPHEVVEKVLRNAIQRVLLVNPLDFDAFVRERMKVKKPVVIMFVGVNGTGKTTSIGRIGHRLKQQGISSVLAAGDTFRAGAIEQLSLHGERLGITVVKHKAGADPAAVAYDAIEHAKARHKDVVLLDTAGRMQNNSNLMDEMDKIRRVANPDLCIFVGDSLAGNDAVEQARKFDEVVDVGGVILTKVDVDAKGGAALSVAYTINKPLLFVGVGQGYDDLKPFDAKWLVDRLFGDDEQAAVAA
ncbi:MAG: signal recognition particle-docking protein FtsY [Candidatus Thermoplasmatota archaeon]